MYIWVTCHLCGLTLTGKNDNFLYWNTVNYEMFFNFMIHQLRYYSNLGSQALVQHVLTQTFSRSVLDVRNFNSTHRGWHGKQTAMMPASLFSRFTICVHVRIFSREGNKRKQHHRRLGAHYGHLWQNWNDAQWVRRRRAFTFQQKFCFCLRH